jgi:peptidoglycan/LPS O-acetylase OafA/YrhL
MPNLKYRPDIDGLRAVAVLSVLVFHLNPAWLPGGYVGVDVFFVISGYLITSIIYGEQNSGQFSLSRFYQRRIARIFPLFFIVLAVTLLFASQIYSQQDFSSAGAVAMASALSITNIKMMFQGSYFELSPDAQPLMHFWSLSVEEQFYLFYPFLLLLLNKTGLKKRGVTLCLFTLFAISLASCLWLTSYRQTWAFFLLPTRAWELLGGGILAIVFFGRQCNETLVGRIWQYFIGICLLLVAASQLGETSEFPGYLAAMPVLGTLLLISAGHQCPAKFPPYSCFALFPLVWIGKVSYSLYLWHWPVYCFVDYSLFGESEKLRCVLKVIITLLLAVSSYYLLERPSRAWLCDEGEKRKAFLGFATLILVFSLVGMKIRQDNYVNAEVEKVLGGGVEFLDSAGRPNIVLMGDSQGSMYGTLLRDIARQQSLNLNVISDAGGNPMPGNRLYDDSLAFLKRCQPDVTVVAIAWSAKLKNQKELLDEIVADVLRESQSCILIGQPPILPELATREAFRANGFFAVREEEDKRQARMLSNELLSRFESERVKVVLVDEYFLDSEQNIRFVDENGLLMFHDKTHLSRVGAEKVSGDLIAAINQMLRK